VKRRPFGRKIFFPERAVVHEVRRERDDAGMSAVSGASPDAAPSGAVRAVELAIRGDRTSCAATVEKKLIKLAEGLLAAAVLARCGTPQAPVTPGVVKVVAGENFWGNIAAQVGGRHARVTSILSSPAADPHLYESDVASALAVAQARPGHRQRGGL